jgi:hypothetical protein
LGIVKTLYIFVGPYMLPIDFVVLDMPRDPFYPIIFGRPFLMTSRARIDHKREVVSFGFGEDEIQFNFSKFKNQPYHSLADTKENEIFLELSTIHLNDPEDALERSLTNNANIPNDEQKKVMDTHLDTTPSDDRFIESTYVVLERKEDDETLPFEYRPLLKELRYEFLDGSSKCPIIIRSTLSGTKEEKLMRVLRKHPKAFGYSCSICALEANK